MLFQTPNLSPTSPLVTVSSLCLWVYFCFVYKFICIIFFLDSTYKQCHMLFVFVWLALLSMIISESIDIAANGIIIFYD